MFAASSQRDKPPHSVIKPAIIQITISNSPEFTCLAISAETINIPQPIIEPATIDTASVRESVLFKS